MEGKSLAKDGSVAASQNIKEREYWLNQLSGEWEKSVFLYDNPTAEPGSVVNKWRLEEMGFKLSATLSERLLHMANGSDTRLYCLILTAVTVLIDKYTGNHDIIVGAPIYRQEKEDKGDFINTVLTLRNRIGTNVTFKELLITVSRKLFEVTEHQNYPLVTLLYKLNIPFSEDDFFPLFDIIILLENIHDKNYILDIKTNIIFSFSRHNSEVKGTVEYNRFLYREKTIQRIVNHFKHLLQIALFNVDIQVSSIDLPTNEEKKRLLFDFNDTAREYPGDQTIPQLFENQAAQIPEHIAVISMEQHLTYKELNKKANQLARFLRKKGVKPDVVVGLMVERSLDMLIAILAVIKAGGGYMPIDPEAPQNRIAGILKDSQAPFLLTDSGTIENHSLWDLPRAKSGKIKFIMTPPRAQLTDLDSLPLPMRSAVDYEKYNQYIGLAMVKDSMALQATRGCPYHCAYCHKIWPKNHVYRSAEHVFSEVKRFYDIGIRRFIIIDDIFNFNRKNSAKFFQLLIKNNLEVQLFFPNGLRGDILTPEYIDLMVEAGTTTMGMALETASPRLQKLIRKNLNLDKLKENLDYFCQKHPQVILELFIMHGFPTETEEEAMKTFEFVKSIKWIHFPYIEILKIYPNTDMEQLALKNGVSYRNIMCSRELAFHQLPDTLPFSKNFTRKYQSTILNEYFLSKERLLSVLPQQMRVLTRDEIVQKYNSYLPTDIDSFADILEFAGIEENELAGSEFPAEDYMYVPDLNEKLQACFPKNQPGKDALRILLLDLSQSFSHDDNQLMDMIEPPLGLMYLMSSLTRQLGPQVNCKIAKSMIDFDSYAELKALIDEFRPEVIGIRTLTYYRNFFHKTITMIRRWGIDVPIIAGGPYATSDYQSALQDQNIDLVVLGEGEKTFTHVIRKIRENGKKLPDEEVLKAIPGVAFVPSSVKSASQPDWDILMLDVISHRLTRQSNKNLQPINSTRDLSYLIYTSGSTGQPKGAMLEHMGMMNHLQAKIKDLALTAGSIVAQNASYTFDISVWQLLASLTVGGKTVIYPTEVVMDPEALIGRIIRDRISVLEVVPSYLTVMLYLLDSKFQELPSLIYLLVTGETVKPALVERWFEKYPGIKLVNAYGPTEASDDITHYIMSQSQPMERIPIGKPLQNLKIYIVDENMNLCPVGIKGEICVSGVGVGRGYLNNPELTAEKFVRAVKGHWSFVSRSSKRLSQFTNDRLYFTGDLGRWLDDGTIEFFGRKDYQVKIRGFRIELGEIESVLTRHPGINEAAVIDKEEKKGNRFLCAYLVTRLKLPVQTIKDHLLSNLSEYMVPTAFMQLEKMPLTANGKIDRKKLRELHVETREPEFIDPANELEEKLLNIWQEVLKIERTKINTTTNFFDLGGNSLNSTLMVSKIQKELNVKVRLMKVFEKQTIKELAAYIQGLKETKFNSVKNAEKKEYYPMSSVQKRLYILLQMKKGNLSYNMPTVLILQGEIDRKKFEESTKKLIKRHETFRTSFELIKGVPVQRIHDSIEFTVDYSEMNEKNARKSVNRFNRPFDLSQPPLLRIGLIKIGKDQHILLISMHHIISDGGSSGIYLKDFVTLHQGDSPPPLKFQYKDYSEWQNSSQVKEERKKQETYWLEQFEGKIPLMNLPLDYDRPAVQDFAGNIIYFRLDPGETGKLRRLAAQENATTYMILLALYYVFLSKICSQEDIVVGTSTLGRTHIDLENIIGMFVNTLPLRSYPRREKTFRDFLKEVRIQALEAFENQLYQFDELVERLNIKGNPNRNPLFDVEFSFQNIPMTRIGPSGLKSKPYDYKIEVAQFDLTLLGIDIQEQIFLSFNYKTTLFKKKTIEMFIHYFKQIVSSVAANPERKLADIEIISKTEKDTILSEFNVPLEEE